jgi:hypothetical protein
MIWKDVVGYEGIYQVSETGLIYSIGSNKVISTKTNNRQYVQVHLHKDGKCSMKLVHRLVAEAFVANEKALPQVNHKDENKNNNHYSNLEWCTNIYNRRYGTGYQRAVDNHDYKAIGRKRLKPVRMLTLDGKHIETFPCSEDAEQKTGIRRRHIRGVCRNGRTAGGYRWEYCA